MIRLRAVMEAVDNVELPPFVGSTLRGAFGNALKSTLCLQGGSCEQACRWPATCPYGLMFETPIPKTAPARLKSSRFAPHPYVFTPPVEGGLLLRGDRLSFDFTLWGSATRHMPHAIRALATMAQRGIGKGRASLTLVDVIDVPSGRSAYANGALDVDALTPVTLSLAASPDDDAVRGVRIKSLTPLKLQRGGRLVNELDFPELVYSAADRLHLMFHCHGDPQHAPDPRRWAGLAREAGIVRVEHTMERIGFERYSGRQDRKHRLEGILGTASFVGDLAPFMPLLRAAALVHIGNGTSFGLGAFQLDETRAASSASGASSNGAASEGTASQGASSNGAASKNIG